MEHEERLQKIIAAAGLASRRKAEILIREGKVSVNGKVITELGAKAIASRDYIKVDGKLIRAFPEKIYILLNKPRHVICSASDPQGRIKVTDLVHTPVKIYPVGRLDYNSEGLILLTNDGEFARIVTSAGSHLPKTYLAKVQSMPRESDLARLRKGIRLKDGTKLAPCKILPLKEGNNPWFEIILTQGKNRQIRDMFDSIGHSVLKLRRTRIGFLADDRLASGQYRKLTANEVERILRSTPNTKARA
jgi:23S rRNA pseudouridine2605 synthase